MYVKTGSEVNRLQNACHPALPRLTGKTSILLLAHLSMDWNSLLFKDRLTSHVSTVGILHWIGCATKSSRRDKFLQCQKCGAALFCCFLICFQATMQHFCFVMKKWPFHLGNSAVQSLSYLWKKQAVTTGYLIESISKHWSCTLWDVTLVWSSTTLASVLTS